jgi:hypothetical protein
VSSASHSFRRSATVQSRAAERIQFRTAQWSKPQPPHAARPRTCANEAGTETHGNEGKNCASRLRRQPNMEGTRTSVGDVVGEIQ